MTSGFAGASLSERGAADSLYLVGLWLLQRQRYRDAAAVARTLVRHAPYDERCWLLLGACHERSEQTELALEMYGVGRAVAAPAPRCELARARLLRANGMHGEASDAYALAASAAAQVADDDLAEFIECERKRGW